LAVNCNNPRGEQLSTNHKGVPGSIILGLAAVIAVGLITALAVLMQEPEESKTHIKAAGKNAATSREIVRLPEELTAEFQYRRGWWVANGPADDNALKRLTEKQKDISRVLMNQAVVSAKGLELLQGHELHSLDITDCELNIGMAKSISQMSGLKELLLKDPKATDEVMKAFTGPNSVQSLVLKNSPVTAAGLQQLSSVYPELRVLSFINCKGINDLVVPILINCHKLQSLNLDTTSVTEDGAIQLVTHLPIANLLFEKHGQVDELVEHLNDTKITSLSLSGNALNEKVLARLSKIKQLKSLNLTQCPGLTNKRLSVLKKNLPDCQIHLREIEHFPELELVK